MQLFLTICKLPTTTSTNCRCRQIIIVIVPSTGSPHVPMEKGFQTKTTDKTMYSEGVEDYRVDGAEVDSATTTGECRMEIVAISSECSTKFEQATMESN